MSRALLAIAGLAPLHALVLGPVLTATSVSISAHVLGELGHLRRREGSVIMGAAVIDDVWYPPDFVGTTTEDPAPRWASPANMPTTARALGA